MKITCTKRDDILKRKQEYEADRAQRQARYDAQSKNYDDEDISRKKSIEDAVKQQLGDTGLDLSVSVRDASWGNHSYQVDISDEDDKFNPDKALSWSWKVYLTNEGEVTKESSSWSGLNAVSKKNLDNLKKILSVLEKLNSIDWKSVLSVRPPKYNDYITEKDPQWDRDVPDFDKELLEADIEELIGTNQGVLRDSGSKYYRGNVYSVIVKQSGSQYTVADVPEYTVSQNRSVDISSKIDSESYRISKDKFFQGLVQPLQIHDFSKEG